MTRIALVLTALLLTLAPAAAAKELGRVSVCGADGCNDVSEQATHAVLDGGAPTIREARPSEEHFVVRITVMEGKRELDRFDVQWFPKARLLRGADGFWMRTPAATHAELARLTSGMKPYGKAEEDGGGGPSTALAIGAPAALLLGIGGVLARRRRRR
ncbi:MAG TPA: LPXTG cell wall anchor domain-containing protein [Solirubrobacteraceae bacterium]|jgi:LPXTG-motif cell wall-anchored protein